LSVLLSVLLQIWNNQKNQPLFVGLKLTPSSDANQ
jgi:hypothetical protein